MLMISILVFVRLILGYPSNKGGIDNSEKKLCLKVQHMDSQAGDSAMAGHQLKLSKVKNLAYRFDFRQICIRSFLFKQ